MLVRIVPGQSIGRMGQHVPFFVLCFLLVALLFPCPLSCLYVCLLAADAALKEEHVIDGRTIDVKRAVPRDRAPLPRLVRVMRVDFSVLRGWVVGFCAPKIEYQVWG